MWRDGMGTEPSYGSSFSYLLALALYLGYKHIILEYCQLTELREAYIEAPNMIQWATLARGFGAYVDLSHTRFGDVYKYGYEDRPIPVWARNELRDELIIRKFSGAVALQKECEVARIKWENEYFYPPKQSGDVTDEDVSD